MRLDARIKAFDAELAVVARSDAAMRRLATVPGIGPNNATAPVAAVGDARAFSRGRDVSAWLGLVPRQATTGGKPRLLGISKQQVGIGALFHQSAQVNPGLVIGCLPWFRLAVQPDPTGKPDRHLQLHHLA